MNKLIASRRQAIAATQVSRVVFALALTFVLGACGGKEETTSITDSEGNERSVSATDEGGERAVSSADGLIRAVGTQGGKNARFPDHTPQYPGATIQSVVDMDVGNPSTGVMNQHIITQQTADALDKVIEFYKEKLKASGKKVMEIDSGTGPMLMIGEGSMLDMEGSVTAMPVASGGTSVNVTVMERVAKQ